MKICHVGSLVFAFGIVIAVTAQNVTNFASPKGVFDFEFSGDIVWAATSGGLYNYNVTTGVSFLRPATSEFPDPSIRALCRDGAGNLWVGTRNGFLMMQNGSGKEYVNSSYVAAGWSISDIVATGPFLIIASEKGVSLFDTEKQIVLKNATRFGTFSSPQIYTLLIRGKTLFIGGESGMARLKIPIDSIAQVNFYDPSIWLIDTASRPVHSFYVEGGEVHAYKGASGWFRNNLLLGDSTHVRLYAKVPDSVTFSSVINVIKDNNGKCWIGTEEDFFTCWGDGPLEKHTIPGPSFSGVYRVLVDRTGVLWALPYGHKSAEPWWLGINSFNGKNWNVFGPLNHPEMGHMGGEIDAFGILQTQDGSMWFGFSGGQIKRYNPADNGWSHYCVFGQGGDGNGRFIKALGPCPGDWGKCDVLAQDSAGYMWISSWNNADGTLLCYKPDPREDNELMVDGQFIYRRFPPKGIVNNDVNIAAITVDQQQNVIYGTSTGELTIAEKVNNPLTDPVGLRIIKQFDNLKKVYKVVAFGDGTSLVISNAGVYRFDPTALTLKPQDGFEKNVTTLAAENDAVFWYGVTGEGVVRYDFLNNEKAHFTRANGLASNQVNDIFIDKERGYVWIATDMGVSRLAMGYTAATASKNSVTVFPNIFSRKEHTVVFFRNIPPDGSVRIHALSGNLVGKPELVRKGDGGASYRWSPPSHLAPGTYFYVVSTPSKHMSGKIMLTP